MLKLTTLTPCHRLQWLHDKSSNQQASASRTPRGLTGLIHAGGFRDHDARSARFVRIRGLHDDTVVEATFPSFAHSDLQVTLSVASLLGRLSNRIVIA